MGQLADQRYVCQYRRVRSLDARWLKDNNYGLMRRYHRHCLHRVIGSPTMKKNGYSCMWQKMTDVAEVDVAVDAGWQIKVNQNPDYVYHVVRLGQVQSTQRN